MVCLWLFSLLPTQLFAQPANWTASKVPVTQSELVNNAWVLFDKKEDKIVSTLVIMYFISDSAKQGVSYAVVPSADTMSATLDAKLFHWAFNEDKQTITEMLLAQNNKAFAKKQYGQINEEFIKQTISITTQDRNSPISKWDTVNYLGEKEYRIRSYRDKEGDLQGIELTDDNDKIYLSKRNKEIVMKVIMSTLMKKNSLVLLSGS
jgi:hypothetical protein